MVTRSQIKDSIKIKQGMEKKFFYLLSLSFLFANILFKIQVQGNSLADQRLGLHAFTAEGPGSIPGQGTEIPQATWGSKKKKKKKNSGL